MKQMAAEMQRELGSRPAHELRRGIFELPQETAESAAQMRRVIVDQIEALAELNRIVARHGRNLDAVEPRRAPREEPALAIAAGGEPQRATARRVRRRAQRRRQLRAGRPPRRSACAQPRAQAGRQPHRLAHRSAQPRLAR